MCQINNPNYDFTPKGWECPKCGKVYSPYQYECTKCGHGQFEFGSDGTGDPIPNDFVTISTTEIDNVFERTKTKNR